ncbi:MAG: transaldolase family protein, partial [Spirochaetota bacterium]
AKIPVIESGIEAMAELIERNIPICATECFSISQTIAICDLYERISKKKDKSPPFFITHITGIFDEEIKAYVEREKVNISPKIAHEAGSIVARKAYRVLKERGYRAALLCGGARGTHHFTELVGGDLHVTLNWSTIEELIASGSQVVSRIDVQTPQEVIDELSNKLPDFKKAYYEDGLKTKDFKNFAPLQRFRNNFLEGWNHLLREIANLREKLS